MINRFIILALILMFLLGGIFCYGAGEEEDFNKMFEESQDSGEPVNTEDAPKDTPTQAPEKTPFTQNGKEGKMGGLVSINSDGTINAEDLITQSNDEGNGVESFSYTDNGYNVGHTDYWQTPTHTIYNGNGIQKTANAFSVKSADKIELNNMTLKDAELLYSTEDALSIVSAEEVEGNGLEAENIMNSNLQFDNGLTGGKILSSKDNNT